jgi:uncharacterized protein
MLAVVTGASRGLGESYARQLAARGYALHLVGRDRRRLAWVASEIRTAHQVAVEEIILDLAQPDGAERLYAETRRRRATHVDLLVNNAGFGLYGEFARCPSSRIREMLLLHVLTVAESMRLFLPEMRERRGGAVINVASVAGLLPIPYMALYAATKAFMVNLGASVAWEMRPYAVVVQTCCPGRTLTEFHASAGISRPYAVAGSQTADEVVAESLDALAREREMVITGRRNRVLMTLQALLPRRVVLGAIARRLQPLSERTGGA